MPILPIAMTGFLQQLWQVPFSLFAEQPVLRFVQAGLLILGFLEVFILFWTTRDILLRSESLAAQFFSLATVVVFPIAGFLLYLLMRPSRTLRERRLEQMLAELLRHQKKGDRDRQKPKKDRGSPPEESPAVAQQSPKEEPELVTAIS